MNGLSVIVLATAMATVAAAAAAKSPITNLSDVMCGKIALGSRRFHARIKGGMPIPVTEFPHAVSIRKAGKHHCGGSLVRMINS
jgi:hypothetical protein